MKYDLSVWVDNFETEMDPDSWIMGPDDDFIPAPITSVLWCPIKIKSVDYQTAMDIVDSCQMIPGASIGHVDFNMHVADGRYD